MESWLGEKINFRRLKFEWLGDMCGKKPSSRKELVKIDAEGIPWRSSSWDSMLSLQGVRVQSLVRELRSHMPYGVAKNQNKTKQKQRKKQKDWRWIERSRLEPEMWESSQWFWIHLLWREDRLKIEGCFWVQHSTLNRLWVLALTSDRCGFKILALLTSSCGPSNKFLHVSEPHFFFPAMKWWYSPYTPSFEGYMS